MPKTSGLVGLGPFGRRLGGGRRASGGICQWIGEVFVDDRRKFGCAHKMVSWYARYGFVTIEGAVATGLQRMFLDVRTIRAALPR